MMHTPPSTFFAAFKTLLLKMTKTDAVFTNLCTLVLFIEVNFTNKTDKAFK